MKTIHVVLYTLAGCLVFLMVAFAIVDNIPYWRAKPPSNVKDLRSFFAWMPEPIRAFRITVESKRYYQITGPAGRYLASGPSAYTFDEQGGFIGWTPDMGDFYTPKEVFSPKAKEEEISLDEMKMLMKSSSNQSMSRTRASAHVGYL